MARDPRLNPLHLTDAQRHQLELACLGGDIRKARRAKLLLRCADGGSNTVIARELQTSAGHVRRWRRRFAEHGLSGLEDRPRKGRPVENLDLSEDERLQLERLVRRATIAQRLALRARIVLLCGDGRSNADVAASLRVTPATVAKWRGRFAARRMKGIEDLHRSGTPRKIGDEVVEDVVVRTLETMPKGATHWSTRSMAPRVGLSPSSVGRIWRALGLQPHRAETHQLSTDPFFIEKVRDVVGLYMSPPDNALVLCVDEKSQIQALNRSQPLLPMRPGQPERRTPEYQRNGTTTLFAALNVATGHVIGKCYHRHRATEFRKFLREIRRRVPDDLQVHIIVDNYATHSAATVKRWLSRNPRFHLHFIPTHSSWLNEVEAWFSILTTRQIKRGSHHSVAELETAIHEFLDAWNEAPKPFRWTKSADEILRNVARYCHRTLQAHEPDQNL